MEINGDSLRTVNEGSSKKKVCCDLEAEKESMLIKFVSGPVPYTQAYA